MIEPDNNPNLVPGSFEHLCILSERTRPSAVLKWCQRNGIHCLLSADNRPVTTPEALNRALDRGRTTSPNFAAVKR